MQPLGKGTDDLLERIWEPNRDYLRRFLIGLSRDIDLAEDLLQETYLHARAGVSGYRGGEARAWLSAIARNTFYAHARRTSIRAEIPLEFEPSTDTSASSGSSLHLDCIQLREAISHLSPALKATLIMKHYGGFTYEEIAERQGCPAGTARRRVWAAMQKLRTALIGTEEEAEMTCDGLRGTTMLDYIYRALSNRRAEAVEAHLKGCAACRREAGQLSELISGLDSVEGDFKLTEIHDVDEDGLGVDYEWCTMVNDFGEAMETTWWMWDRKSRIYYAMAQGEELTLEYSPSGLTQYMVEAKLPRPVAPGERYDTMYACRRTEGENAFQQIRENRWLYNYGRTPNSDKDWVYVLALRLPPGAKLATATPEPTEVRQGVRVTVVWRALLPRVQVRENGTCPWQFECSAEIDWVTDAPLHAKPEPLPPPVPNDLLDVSDRILALPYSDAEEESLALLAEAHQLKMPYYRAWFELGIRLFGSRCYEEALGAFRQSIALPALPGLIRKNTVYLAHAWQGIVLDLLGRREEALREYNDALANPGRWVSNMQVYNLRVDKAFIEERLKTPFVRK